MIAKPLTMTVVCKCGYQYGVWRYHCPVCGTSNSHRTAAVTPKVEARIKREVTRRVKQIVNQCILCRLGGAKYKCPHCDELAHKGCLELHRGPCLKFQFAREIEIQKLKEATA